MDKPDESKIACAICGLRTHSLSYNHIRTHGINNAQYREQYPDAPLTSPWFKQQASERSKKNNAARKGVPRSDEVKQKISAVKKRKFATGETKPHFLGKKHSAESKELMSTSAKATFENGRVHHMQGKQHDEDTKTKISTTAKLQDRKLSSDALTKRKNTMAAKSAAGWTKNRQTAYMSDGDRALVENRDWLVHQHVTHKKPIYQIADEIGVDRTTVSDRFHRFGIRVHTRFSTSRAEREIAEFLATHDITVVSNTRSIIPPYEVDVWLPDQNIAIEHCGLHWHSSKYKPSKYHKDKLDLCKSKGIRLITIFEDEWIDNQSICKSKLLSIVGKLSTATIYARKCTIDPKVLPTERKAFFDTHHIQRDGPGSVAIGLRHNGSLVAVGLFIIRGEVAVLNRYATSVHVPGGLSKIITAFKKTWPNITKLESFADLRWSEGNLYQATGWKHEYTIPPDYYWVKGLRREHKFGFRHKHLPTKLAVYDPNLTEVENCVANGWLQIYDCGKQKWTLEL